MTGQVNATATMKNNLYVLNQYQNVNKVSVGIVALIDRNPLQCRSNLSHADTESITSDIGPLPNPPIYMPYSATYNPSHGYQPIQYGLAERHGLSSGSSSSDVLTSKDISASQSDITSVIHQTNQMTIGHHHGSNKSSGSSNRGGGGNINNEQESSVFNYVL